MSDQPTPEEMAMENTLEQPPKGLPQWPIRVALGLLALVTFWEWAWWNKVKKKLPLGIVAVLLCVSANASIVFLSQSGSGDNSGSSSGNRKPIGAWNLSPSGTGLSMGGTFTTTLTNGVSGTAGSPFVITFEAGANFTTGCWPAQAVGAISLNSQSYITIDGGANGIIQNTSNGTGLATANDSSGIGGEGYFITIKNLTITNIYVAQPGDTARLGYCLNVSGSAITVSNCSLSWADGCFSYIGPQPGGAFTTESNIFAISNTFNHYNHGINWGVGNGATSGQNVMLTNTSIIGNTFSPWGEFVDGGGGHHLDDIIIFNSTDDPTCIMANHRCYGNTFTGNFGPNGSSAFFLNIDNNTAQYQNFYVYNNLFLATSNSWNDGFCQLAGSNVWFANNTCMGGGTQGGSVQVIGTNAYHVNNLEYSGSGVTLGDLTGLTVTNSGACLNVGWIVSNTMQSAYSDFNAYATYSVGGFGFKVYGPSIGSLQYSTAGGFTTLANWQTYIGNTCNWSTPIWNASHCDPHSSTNYPVFVVNSFVPASTDTVLKGQGTNLMSLGITTDFNGALRPATGAWTIGAFVAGVGTITVRSVLGAATAWKSKTGNPNNANAQ